MARTPLLLNFPLKVRGIKGVISAIFHNSPCPSYLKRGIFAATEEIRVLMNSRQDCSATF
jgi:hypothetical protein